MFLGNIALCDMITGLAAIAGHFSVPYLEIDWICVIGVGREVLKLKISRLSNHFVKFLRIDFIANFSLGLQCHVNCHRSVSVYFIRHQVPILHVSKSSLRSHIISLDIW